MSLNDPPIGEPGTAITIKVSPPDKEAAVKLEQDRDALFPDTGSFLVWGIRPTLENLLNEHKKELTKYHRLLGKHKINLRIRLTHTTIERGVKYTYCGRYVYTKENKYVSKLSNAVLRDEMKEKWNKIGGPPKNPLEGLKFRIFRANGEKTDCCVIPYEHYYNHKFGHLFMGKTAVRMGGL